MESFREKGDEKDIEVRRKERMRILWSEIMQESREYLHAQGQGTGCTTLNLSHFAHKFHTIFHTQISHLFPERLKTMMLLLMGMLKALRSPSSSLLARFRTRSLGNCRQVKLIVS